MATKSDRSIQNTTQTQRKQRKMGQEQAALDLLSGQREIWSMQGARRWQMTASCPPTPATLCIAA
ncbi:hypothetical protein GUJ93_ZPchr0008g12342 [Zizania palustris]|uniref:Uncharacterized protein n=1 Tax=Zizania palustris TaxID=103762 RepID=A0A8J5RHD0_ZIZPA|nr:hypothetical protein GUJ93_ZPchr0008g12342 [Zizania palustris]